MKKVTAIILLVLLLLTAFSGCTAQERFTQSDFELFDTASQLIGYESSLAEFEQRFNEVFAQLREYHELYDIYEEYEGINNLKTVNDNAGVAPVKVDPRIIDLLLFAKQAYELTDGRVNVALGSVLRIWHDCREAALAGESVSLPDEQQLAAAAQHTNINDIVIDEQAQTVYLSDPLMSLDVGALAKGYAAQQLTLYFTNEGMSSYLLSLGGNVCAPGQKPDSQPWKVAIQNPYNTESYACTLKISGQCVVTSGSYQRYFELDGVRYCHIIDPQTLIPATLYDSVTVICESSALADALSTALFVMPLEQGRALVESLEGVEAMWIISSEQTVYTDGAAALLVQ